MKTHRHAKYTSNRTRKLHKTSHRTPQFLYHPNNPAKSFNVYIDKNPKDTIHIKYKTIEDVKNTINHLESLYKNKVYPHKRIWQVGMIMKVRLEVLKEKKPAEFKLAKKYFEFLGQRTQLPKNKRYSFVFHM
jgi:hypothetical protein